MASIQNKPGRTRHLRSGRILVQMGAIIAIGLVIGVADAFLFRPVDLSARTAPPSVDDLLNQGEQTSPGESPGTRTAPAENGNTQAPVTPPDDGAATTPAPTTPTGFAFTPKDKLPAGHVTIEEAKRLLDAGAMFVDSRKASEYAEGHVENAIRIDTSMFKAGDPVELSLIPRSAVVVVYCNGGNCDESDNLAKLLDLSGYGKVYVMHDGFPGWKAAGHAWGTGSGGF